MITVRQMLRSHRVPSRKPAAIWRRLRPAAVLWVAFGAAQVLFAQPQPFFDVKRYGAAGNGVALDTEGIRKAIDACAAAGGGTVYFPAGAYLSGTLRLKDNLTLWLDSGATLLGSKDLSHYQTGAPGQDWYQALILGKGLRNVAVVGRGTIDGNKVFNPKGEERMRGPHAILFSDCQDVTVRDVSFKDAGNYALILRSCEGVNVDGITARGGWDGINMHDTRNATISNCRLFTGDDALAGAYWENVTVNNCILNSSANAVRVGGRNVLFNNCLIYGPGEAEHQTSLRHRLEAGFQILPHRAPAGGKSSNRRVAPGPIDNIVLSNITMINVGTPLWVAYSADAPYSANSLGLGRLIVNNLTVLQAGKTPLYVSAPLNNPAKSVVLNNVRITVAGRADETQSQGQGQSVFSILQSYGIYCRNVERLELHDVRVDYREPDSRAPIFGENIGTLELDRFVGKREEGGPPILLASGLGRLLVDGREAGLVQARVKGLELPSGAVFAGEPFQVTATVENPGREGLAVLPLRLGRETLSRSVWLNAGETSPVRFLNLRYQEPGEIQVQLPGLAKKLTVLPRDEGRPVAAPYRTASNVDAQLRQLGRGFYLRVGGDYTVMEYGDQYGSVYSPDALPRNGVITVKLENPDLRTHWPGRAGIIVRNDISKLGQSPGYLIFSSSPAAGTYLEWDADGNGRLDQHTEIEGYTVWPHWLKLERNANRFTGYSSIDGANWAKVGEAEVPGVDELLDAGMFAWRSSARFEGFRIEKQAP